MIQHQRSINMYPGVRAPERIHLSQYDSDFTLVFNLYSSAGSFSVESGTTAMIRGTKGDGNGYSASASLSGTTVTIQGNNQMTAVAGPNTFELTLTRSGKVLSTANFILDVEPAAMDANTIQSDSVLMELQAIIESASTSTAAATRAEEAAQAAEGHANGTVRFDTTQSLTAAQKAQAHSNIGLDNTLTVQGIAADAKKVGDEISDLKGALYELTVDKVAIPKTENYYINLTTDPVDIANPSSSSTGLAYSIADCAEGDKFIINAVGAVNGRAWGFLDSGNHVISMADENATVSNLELTAPANAVKLVINDKGGLTSYRAYENIVGRVETLENNLSLLSDEIPNTTQTYTFSDGGVSQVTHTRNNVAIRTDVFTYGATSITEVRTLDSGESLTIATNLTTLETTVTYSSNAYELLYTITGFQKCIGYTRDDGTGYITDASESAACAYLGNYALRAGDKIKFEDESGLYTLGIGTNNPNASSDGKYIEYNSGLDGLEYTINDSHLSDCKVADVRKKDGSTISASELATINQIVKVYRKEEI